MTSYIPPKNFFASLTFLYLLHAGEGNDTGSHEANGNDVGSHKDNGNDVGDHDEEPFFANTCVANWNHE